MTRDADFSKVTIRRLAERSAYRCSIPECDKITIGPGAKQDEPDCTGIASHIYSAAPKGPRGSGGLTVTERKSIANGIWLCSDHASLVDKHRGDRYPPELLISYKALHEARIAREQKGIYSPIGWFQELIIHTSPLFVPSTKIRFGKLTMIVGENVSGKTAICEWISGFSDSTTLDRWGLVNPITHPLNVELFYYCPQPDSAKLEISTTRELKQWHGLQPSPTQALNLHFIFPKDVRAVLRKGLDDLNSIAQILGIQTAILKSILPLSGQSDSALVKNVRLISSNGGDRVAADVEGTSPGLTFRSLSSSEQIMVVLELAVCLAQYTAEFGPTLLILDEMWLLDTGNLVSHAKYLSSTEFNFQTLSVIPERSSEEIDRLKWAGWEIVRLHGKKPNVRVSYSIR